MALRTGCWLRVTTPFDLRLTRCTTHQNLRWYHDEKGNQELSSHEREDRCVSFEDNRPAVGSKLQVMACNGSVVQSWQVEISDGASVDLDFDFDFESSSNSSRTTNCRPN